MYSITLHGLHIQAGQKVLPNNDQEHGLDKGIRDKKMSKTDNTLVHLTTYPANFAEAFQRANSIGAGAV